MNKLLMRSTIRRKLVKPTQRRKQVNVMKLWVRMTVRKKEK